MPANFDSGFFVREPAWHGEGTVLETYPGSWDEAARLAGLDWEPIKRPCYDRELVGMGPDGEPVYEYAPDPEHTFIVRSDTGARLDVVNASYEPIPNATLGEMVEALQEADAEVRYETAGSLFGGRRVWALALLDAPIHIGLDPSLTANYLAILNTHDGTGAVQAIATSVRIVCANTWHASDMEGQRTGHAFKFKHTKNWRMKLEDAKAAIQFGRKQSQELTEALEALTHIRVTAKQTEVFVQEFIPMPVGQVISDRVVSNVETARQALRDILAGPTCEGITGTAYGLTQSAGEYLDHVRRYKTYSSYVNRTLLATEPLKARAAKLALEVARG